MTYENFYGWESDAVWFYPGWRCVHCGEVVDPVIYLNRRLNSQHFWKDEETPRGTPILPLEVVMGHPAYASVADEIKDDF
ncbi:MAG: hypothetical protein HY037_00380 [Nitrospirae bacterium]|nr:hypothetical protein [Candidatus Troglogloeales bacterium]